MDDKGLYILHPGLRDLGQSNPQAESEPAATSPLITAAGRLSRFVWNSAATSTLRARFRQTSVWADLPVFDLHAPAPDDFDNA
jgi:hypothetical protein